MPLIQDAEKLGQALGQAIAHPEKIAAWVAAQPQAAQVYSDLDAVIPVIATAVGLSATDKANALNAIDKAKAFLTLIK